MKKYFILFLVLSLVCFGTIGCGAKEKLEEKAAEKLTEKLLEQGGAEDVDIDGDRVIIKGEDGEEMTFGGDDWPDSDLAKNITEFTKGELGSIMENSNYLMVSFEKVKEADAVSYIEKNMTKFSLDNYESKSEDIITWSGRDDKGLQLTLTFADSSFTIMLLDEGVE